MKKKVPKNIEKFRISDGKLASDESFGMNGAFEIPYQDYMLFVIISDGMGWDHVSVSIPQRYGFNRCPDWDEMKWVKSLFFEADETVVQYHPKSEKYLNFHPYVLHLWKKQDYDYPLPPGYMIAPRP